MKQMPTQYKIAVLYDSSGSVKTVLKGKFEC